MSQKRSIGVVLFDQFELLDVFGPLEMFGLLQDHFVLYLVTEKGGEVASGQGPRSIADHSFADGHRYDILFVPGGRGTRTEVSNKQLIDWLKEQSRTAEFVTAVCTGSALLARAGILDGVRATTNKKAFAWVTSQGPNVIWEKQARWVEDGKFFTSSGVSAGMDMSLAVIAKLLGRDTAIQVAVGAEYDWHEDPGWDPFAEIYGLF